MNKLIFKMLHSFTGIYLIGYTIFHLYSNSYIRLGREAYDRMVVSIVHRPYLHVIEVAFIFLPLAFHALYGLYILYQGSDNLIGQSHIFNLLYSVQRWSGAAILLFILFHLGLFKIKGPEGAMTFHFMREIFKSPWVFHLTLAGCFFASFHITGGLWNAGINWGILRGPVVQKRIVLVLAGFGSILFIWTWDIIRAFHS